MNVVPTRSNLPPEAFIQYAEMQESYEQQAGKMSSPSGGLESSFAGYASVPNAEPTVSMLVQLFGLNRQLATEVFTRLSGYQNAKDLQRQKGRLGTPEELKDLLAQLNDREGTGEICEALELITREEEMRLHVLGEMGSLVAA